jgi:DNA-directed RNA polymerase specialized sigma24 family protein
MRLRTIAESGELSQLTREIASLYREDLSAYQIADRLRISHSSVIYHLQKAEEAGEIVLQTNPRAESEEFYTDLRKEIVRLHKEDLSIAEIAEKLNISIKSVRTGLANARKEGSIEHQDVGTRQGRKNITDETRKEIVRLYEEGFSFNEICKRLTINRNTLRRHLKKAEQNGEVVLQQRGVNNDSNSDLGKEIVELAKEGFKIAEIAEKLNISTRIVKRRLAKAKKEGSIGQLRRGRRPKGN